MKSFIAILGMFGVAGASYGAVLFDFNTPGQLTGNFSSGQSGPITQVATGGLSNSGCLNISGTDYNNGPWQIFTLNTPFTGISIPGGSVFTTREMPIITRLWA